MRAPAEIAPWQSTRSCGVSLGIACDAIGKSIKAVGNIEQAEQESAEADEQYPARDYENVKCSFVTITQHRYVVGAVVDYLLKGSRENAINLFIWPTNTRVRSGRDGRNGYHHASFVGHPLFTRTVSSRAVESVSSSMNHCLLF